MKMYQWKYWSRTDAGQWTTKHGLSCVSFLCAPAKTAPPWSNIPSYPSTYQPTGLCYHFWTSQRQKCNLYIIGPGKAFMLYKANVICRDLVILKLSGKLWLPSIPIIGYVRPNNWYIGVRMPHSVMELKSPEKTYQDRDKKEITCNYRPALP